MGSIGGSKSTSKTTQNTPQQRRDIFQGGLQDIGGALGIMGPSTGGPEFVDLPLIGRTRNPNYQPGQINLPGYQRPDYVSPESYASPGEVSRLGGGDYDRLENSIREAQWAPIEALKTQRFKDIDQEVADRGLYTSGVGADTKQSVFTRDFLPAMTSSANQAVATRYGLEQGDNQAANAFGLADAAARNQYNLGTAGMENQFNLGTSAAQQAAQWAPLEYLMQLFGQTGGSNSTSSGRSMNFGIS